MADALVSPAVAGTMYACSAVAAGYAGKKIKIEDDPRKIPTMGVMGAFVFATQMINFTIPGTGSSGHLCGGMLLSAVLGPYAGFLTMIGVLLVQGLFFADGGLLALGCNVWNMAFYGCFLGAGVLWKVAMRHGVSKKKITVISILGCVLTLEMGAFSVTLETLASGVTQLPFSLFAPTMLLIHLAIGVVEGVITAAVLCFIFEARGDVLWIESKNEVSGKMSLGKMLGVLAGAFVIIGAGLSLFASSFPDGLEWSMEKVGRGSAIQRMDGVHQVAEKLQSITSFLPDYSFTNSSSKVGTSVSGIVGGLLVVVLCFLVCMLIRTVKKRKEI